MSDHAATALPAPAALVLDADELADIAACLLDFNVLRGAITGYLHDHPNGLTERDAPFSLAKRLSGQVRSRIDDMLRYREHQLPHWFKPAAKSHRCLVCCTPESEGMHRACFTCGSPRHGANTCPEKPPPATLAGALLERLREHCGNPWSCHDCDPSAGRYCAAAWPDVALFWALRRREVEAARLALAAGGRR